MIRNPFTWSTDDHTPAPVLISPITGKPITIRNHADLSAAVAARHRLGDVARIGWQTRRARHG